ncbi:MAG TPA: M48 family metallopeptidase [Thermoanaerobaculia bacterium]
MHELVRANKRRAAFLVIAMAFLLGAVGYAIGETTMRGAGRAGLLIALIIWAFQAVIAYFAGGRIMLAMSGARKIEKKDHAVLFNVVEEMCVASGNPKVPDIYIIDDDALNAFATGRDPEHAAVAVTSGMLKTLDRDELQGVIAHEISHVRNRDVLYMTMLGVMMGTIVLLADVGVRMRGGSRTRTSRRSNGGGAGLIVVLALLLMIIAPLLARLIYLAVSRKREYLADASGALYTRYPEGLARALEKLGGASMKMRSASAAVAPMYIVEPLGLTEQKLAALGSTHPPIAERVKILRSMGGSANVKSYDDAFRKVTGRPVGVVPFAALQESRPVAAKTAPAAPQPMAAAPFTHVERVRQTTDLLWTLNDYIFINCECGTKLKIPPAYRAKKIECPHCNRVHTA